MTYREMTALLETAGIENAAMEALLLTERFTAVREHMLRADPNHPLPDPEGRLRAALARRIKREPLQYILGSWSFWRQEYEVGPQCLVPRADTECLLERALALLPHGGRVLDLCTGSGCIAISLLCERRDASAVAVEWYEDTLALAMRNAASNGVDTDRLLLLRGDVLHPDFLPDLGQFDLIISNPPYIPTRDLATLPPETKQEPRAALDGGKDGLVFYRRILAPDYRAALRTDGSFCFEIGYDQADALRALARERSMSCQIFRDLGGNDRVAIIQSQA